MSIEKNHTVLADKKQKNVNRTFFSCRIQKFLFWNFVNFVYIGSSKKSCSMKVKKKCKKKWRWFGRKMKKWYICNNNMVFLFAKNLIPNLDFPIRYGNFPTAVICCFMKKKLCVNFVGNNFLINLYDIFHCLNKVSFFQYMRAIV